MEYNLVVEVAFLYFIFLINRFILKHVSAIEVHRRISPIPVSALQLNLVLQVDLQL